MSEVGGLKGVIDECNGIVVANGFMASAVLLPGGKLSYKSKKSHSLDCVIYNQGKIFYNFGTDSNHIYLLFGSAAL